MKGSAFCIQCGCKTHYLVHTSRIEEEAHGVKFTYPEQIAVCEECGEEVYVPEINDENAQAAEAAYRKAANLITVSEIRQLMKKYDIGASPLGKVLGFGEITITRYLSGKTPSHANSQRMLEALASHRIMRESLEKHRDQITEVAYQKVDAALKKLELICDSHNKIDQIANYLLEKCNDITPLSLQKLLYYSQAFSLIILKKPLFENDCQAWAHGPVYPDVYYRFRDFGYDPIRINFEAAPNDLDRGDREVLDNVLKYFGCYSGPVLRGFTHNEAPWIKARNDLQPEDRCVTIIQKEDIKVYFGKIAHEYKISTPSDIKNYSKHLYNLVVGC